MRDARRFEGEDTESDGSESDRGRRSSPESDRSPAKLVHSHSADYLSEEVTHSVDPGSPVVIPPDHSGSPVRPVFKPVIIAPSPIMATNEQISISPETPTRTDDGSPDHAAAADLSEEETLAGFASFGRRESLKATQKPEDLAPRAKTKRELGRERLFRDLDDELEAESGVAVEKDIVQWRGVQEIGMGGGLGARPTSAGPVLEGGLGDLFESNSPSPPDRDLPKSPSLPIAPKSAHLSPAQPFRPSPLHASPLTSNTGLLTPETPADALPRSASSSHLSSLRDYARNFAAPHSPHTRENSKISPSPPESPRRPRRRQSPRVSLVAGRIVQPFAIPPSTALPPDISSFNKGLSLQSFSPFLSSSRRTTSDFFVPAFNRYNSTVSLAPSTDAPSECTTPTSETGGGLGGRGIADYVILNEAGKGAYGLVMRAKVKGPKGEAVGVSDRCRRELMAGRGDHKVHHQGEDTGGLLEKVGRRTKELADDRHKSLGPIPVESKSPNQISLTPVHVMDQLRHVLYHPPKHPQPWDPARSRELATTASSDSAPNTPDSMRSSSSADVFSPTQKYIASELRSSSERGHPNICKLLDFFEDREFYYCK